MVEFRQILEMHLYWQDLGKDFLPVIFTNFKGVMALD